jgi:translation elongation factor EF-Tu-like GTPase
MSEIIFDELRPAGDAPLRVMARVRVISSEEGGKRKPFTARYRPNHNFGSPENRHFFIGQLEVAEGDWVHPGETRDLVITFLNVVGLDELLKVGRVWRIQEGSRLVATAEVLSLQP